MSSERSGSTSPRIREFGLYRNIDARTEEFLKLSKKRQIRQGCTCAAVSTAITVTVVVSVILVHEYSFDSESILRSKNRTTYWYGLMNESDSHFNEKINKAKMYFDKTTVKLLPILIKALNNNTKLQKIIEEYAVPSPSFEIRNTTDLIIKKVTYTKNNNINLPKTRVHKKDFKSIQIVPFKKSSKKLDLFSRNRKSREHVNTSSYLENIIEDVDNSMKISTTSRYLDILTKENPNSTSISNISNTRAYKRNKTWKYPLETTSFLPLIKPRINNVDVIEDIDYKELTNVTQNINIFNESEVLNETLKCKCSKGIIILLSKFLVKLQTLVPNVRKILDLCHEKSRVTTKKNLLRILDKSYVISSTTTTSESLTSSKDSLKKVTSFTELIKNRNQELHDIELVNSIKKQMDNRRRVSQNFSEMLWLKPNYIKKFKPINETLFKNKYNSTTESSKKSVMVDFKKFKDSVPITKSTRTHVVHDKTFQEINSAETLTTTKSVIVTFKTLNNTNAFNDTNTRNDRIYSKELKKILAKNKETTYKPPIYQTKKNNKAFRLKPKFYVPEYKISDNIDYFSRNIGTPAHKKGVNSNSSPGTKINNVNVTGKSNIDQISIAEESNDFEEAKYDDVLPNDEIDDYGFKPVDYIQNKDQNRHSMTNIRSRVNSTLNKQYRDNNRMNQLTSLLNSMIPRKQTNVRELMRNSNWSLDNRDDDYDNNINNNIYN